MARPPGERKKALRLLAINQGDVAKTSAQTGVPKRTLHRWKDSTEFAEALDEAIALYLERSMEVDAVRETSGYYAAQAVQQLVKTRQLVTGGPTDNLHMTGDLASFLGARQSGDQAGKLLNKAETGTDDAKRDELPLN